MQCSHLWVQHLKLQNSCSTNIVLIVDFAKSVVHALLKTEFLEQKARFRVYWRLRAFFGDCMSSLLSELMITIIFRHLLKLDFAFTD